MKKYFLLISVALSCLGMYGQTYTIDREKVYTATYDEVEQALRIEGLDGIFFRTYASNEELAIALVSDPQRELVFPAGPIKYRITKKKVMREGIPTVEDTDEYHEGNIIRIDGGGDFGSEGFHRYHAALNSNSTVESITIPGEIKEVSTVAYNCKNLREVNIEEGVESLGLISAVKGYGGDPGDDPFVFYRCPQLKTLNVPASMKRIYNPSLFYKDPKDPTGPISWIEPGFEDVYSRSAPGFREIKVDPENETYKDVDGIVYTKDGSGLEVVPSGRIKDIVIEEGTKRVANLWNMSYQYTHIIIPASVESCGYITADTIYCFSENPTAQGYDKLFATKVLYVPNGSRDIYYEIFSNFSLTPNIKGFEPKEATIKLYAPYRAILEFNTETAIDSPTVASDEISDIYSLSGMRQGKLSKGINLIRTKDGKVRKVMQR